MNYEVFTKSPVMDSHIYSLRLGKRDNKNVRKNLALTWRFLFLGSGMFGCDL